MGNLPIISTEQRLDPEEGRHLSLSLLQLSRLLLVSFTGRFTRRFTGGFLAGRLFEPLLGGR